MYLKKSIYILFSVKVYILSRVLEKFPASFNSFCRVYFAQNLARAFCPTVDPGSSSAERPFCSCQYDGSSASGTWQSPSSTHPGICGLPPHTVQTWRESRIKERDLNLKMVWSRHLLVAARPTSRSFPHIEANTQRRSVSVLR